MLIDKISTNLYDSYSFDAEKAMLKDAKYKDAANHVIDLIKEVKGIVPEDKSRLVFELEAAINHRESLYAREAYKYAFNQGAKMVMEIITSNYSNDNK